jgi:magnesium chelatase subunit D
VTPELPGLEESSSIEIASRSVGVRHSRVVALRSQCVVQHTRVSLTPMHLYPFSAVVGMERAKRSLLLHAVDPRIGGTLLLGHRGCAKSTLVRGFAALLPTNGAKPAPFVDVPLGVTEDRLLGAVHAESLVRTGAWIPQPGLLESADGGVLYVDEINLLPDAVSDLLLDSAASGIHHQQRDGLSQAIQSRYIFIGTMNPEEGDLRPQLSDRFAHGVQISDAFSPEERVEIGRRRLAFEDDPEAFLQDWETATAMLNAQLRLARVRLPTVQFPEHLRLELAQKSQQQGVEGMRAELAILRTARAAAALSGNDLVNREDMDEAWQLCLGHRSLVAPAQTQPPPSSSPRHSAASQSSNPALQRSPSDSASSTQPLTPKEVHPSSIPLSAMQKPRILSLPKPLFAGRHLTASMTVTSRFETCRLSGSPVLWHASLVASLKRGWKPNSAGWSWVRSSLHPGRRLWALLDASRSTGAAAFLESARETLSGLAQHAKRVSLLLIHNNRVSWLARNQTVMNASQKLASLPGAAGGSPISEALRKLSRSLSGGRAAHRDAVYLFSDGLPSLGNAETAQEAGRKIRAALAHLALNAPARPVWFCPVMARGVRAWFQKIIKGSECQLIEISPR